MKKPENREIDKFKYEILYMGPKLQIKTLKFLAQTVGRPFSVLAQDDSGKGLMDADSKIIGLFINEALVSLDDDAIIEQIESLLQFCGRFNVETNGYAQVQMEVDFHGELEHLFKVVTAILEVNFKSFLGGSTGILKKLTDRYQKSMKA